MIPITIARNFLSCKHPDQLWGPSSLPARYVPGAKLPAREADHSPPPSTGSSVPLHFMLFCFVSSPYSPLFHCKSLFTLLSDPFQVHRYLLSNTVPIFSLLPPRSSPAFPTSLTLFTGMTLSSNLTQKVPPKLCILKTWVLLHQSRG